MINKNLLKKGISNVLGVLLCLSMALSPVSAYAAGNNSVGSNPTEAASSSAGKQPSDYADLYAHNGEKVKAGEDHHANVPYANYPVTWKTEYWTVCITDADGNWLKQDGTYFSVGNKDGDPVLPDIPLDLGHTQSGVIELGLYQDQIFDFYKNAFPGFTEMFNSGQLMLKFDPVISIYEYGERVTRGGTDNGYYFADYTGEYTGTETCAFPAAQFLAARGWDAKTRKNFDTMLNKYWYENPEGNPPTEEELEKMADEAEKLTKEQEEKLKKESDEKSTPKTVYIEKDQQIYKRQGSGGDMSGSSGLIGRNGEIPLQYTPVKYKTGNSSPDGYSIGTAIPSGKDVDNNSEASMWQAATNINVRTIYIGENASKKYCYTDYKWIETIDTSKGSHFEWNDKQGGHHEADYVIDIDYDGDGYVTGIKQATKSVLTSDEYDVTYDYNTHYTNSTTLDVGTRESISYSASYQYLMDLTLWDGASVEIQNKAFEGL